MFAEVSPKVDFPAAEKEILRFWDEQGIYAKTLANRAEAPTFVFFEGPPTANGMPHPGHALTRVIKDIFPRYFTMRGYRCERKAGWDTHGLPVEVEVCKELGIHSKEEIEKFGVEPFIHRCMASVFRYTREWENLTRRLAFWVNMEDAYVTYHQSYIESVWWSLKRLFDRGLLYQGHKVVWWWAQGGTALSAGEVGEGYRDTDDPSIYVRFKLKDAGKLGWDLSVPTSLLAWTTTPWTLSSNVALAVHADFDYVLLEYKTATEHERFVLASELIPKVFAGLKLDLARDFSVVLRCKGKDLVGAKYEPIFRYREPEHSTEQTRAWEVATADFVTLEQGAGIVHIAPAFGEDDYRFARDKGFGFLQMVQPDGTFAPDATDVAGQFCKDADKEIIRILKDRGVLLKRETYRHPYPFCPRAEQDPLIQYARKSWFIKTSEFKDQFLANNAKIDWLPEHIKEGRFGDFLRNNVDWALSRERYWGTPLPIWQCEATGKMEAIACYADLLAKPGVAGFDAWDKAKAQNPELSDHLKVHKPYIDAVTYDSSFSPGARMRRVPDVIDCWYDSGAMPFAQWGFPHANREKFGEQFPADFISEAIDQTRGWFYSQLAIATLLKDDLMAQSLPKRTVGYPVPFKTCIVLGFILGEDGKKMSKRTKNYREPSYIFDKYGADAMRWYFVAAQAPWSTVRFLESAIQESQREFLIRLQNVYSFFVIYANIDGFDPRTTPKPAVADRRLMDRWILSELQITVQFATERMDAFDNFGATTKITEFVDALSNWYVRRSRDRFWAGGMGADQQAAYWTLYASLTTLAKLLAPFVPFFAEGIYQNLVRRSNETAPESVHICDWPAMDESLIDEQLSAESNLVRQIVSVGRSARTDAKLKVRQPLSAVEVLLADHRLDATVAKYHDVIADELNVKKVELVERATDYVTFEIKPNLKALGPRLGKQLPALTKALAAADAAALRQSLVDTGSASVELSGQPFALTADDVMVNLTAKPGYAAAAGPRAVVILATSITPKLRQEGLANDLVRVIQEMRKQAGLAFTDRIVLGIELAPELQEAFDAHHKYICRETLTEEVKAGDLANAVFSQTVEIEGSHATLSLARAGESAGSIQS